MPRPILLKDVRQYAVNFLGAKDIKGVEADDVLNMYGFESHKHYKSTGKHKYILSPLIKTNVVSIVCYSIHLKLMINNGNTRIHYY